MPERNIWNKKSTTDQKVQWLLQNQDLWIGFPSGKGTFNYSDDRYKLIVDKMEEAGLLSMSTTYHDVNLYRLISMSRKLRREGNVK